MKRILITGATRGIGRAIAEKLAAPEVTLLLHGRDVAALEEVQAAVAAKGAHGIPLVFDLETNVAGLITAAGAEPLDVLINNAGIAIVRPFAEVCLDEWQRSLALNVTAPFLLTQSFAPRMAAGASIVNILSVAAKTGFPGWSAYCMSKFALEGFSQSLRAELRPGGVRVINIYPAATATDIWNSVEGEWPREKMMSPNEVAEAVAYAISRPPEVLVENVSLGRSSGNL